MANHRLVTFLRLALGQGHRGSGGTLSWLSRLSGLLKNYASAFAFVINRSTSARTSKIIYFLHCGPVGLWIISIKRRSIILSDTRGSLAKRTLPLIIIDHARTPTSYHAFEPHHRRHPISRIPSCVSLCWLCGKCHWDNWKLIMLTYLESDCWDGDSLMMPEPYNFHTPLTNANSCRQPARWPLNSQRPVAN